MRPKAPNAHQCKWSPTSQDGKWQQNGTYDFLEKRMPTPLRMISSQDLTPHKGCLCPFSSRIELVAFHCSHSHDFAINSNAYFQSIVAYATNSEFREPKNCGFHRMGPIELNAKFPIMI